MFDTSWKSLDYAAINLSCLARFPALLGCWLPDGFKKGGEWVAPNPTRHDNRAGSFSINIDTGRWADFATGDKGGDPISLYAYLNDLSQSQAAQALRQTWGAGQ